MIQASGKQGECWVGQIVQHYSVAPNVCFQGKLRHLQLLRRSPVLQAMAVGCLADGTGVGEQGSAYPGAVVVGRRFVGPYERLHRKS